MKRRRSKSGGLGSNWAILVTLLVFGCAMHVAAAQGKDVFQGKLFPPNVILENQHELELSKEQFTEIRATIVAVQSKLAEHEWDLREAYRNIVAELDKIPADEARVLDNVDAALRAENQVKKQQIRMLVQIRNLLTSEQIAYLESIDAH